MRSGKPNRSVHGAVAVCCALFLALPLLTVARPIVHTLVERTRLASVIAKVKVDSLQSDAINVTVIKTIKGTLSQSTVQFAWNREKTSETLPVSYRIGEQVLLFGNVVGKRLEPLGKDPSSVSADKE